MQGSDLDRRDALLKLARAKLRDGDLDLSQVVSEVRSLFRADACSILLEGAGEEVLRLSQTTDPMLSKEEVTYLKGEGLTGWVYEAGAALLVNRADAPDLVEASLERKREGPRFPERDSRGEICYRFLGVPIRTSERTIGVLRLVRGLEGPELTEVDQRDLGFLADLLGIGFQRSWDVLLLDTILDSESFAILVTRQEVQKDGTYVPRLIRVNPGVCRLLGYDSRDLIGRDASTLYAPEDYKQIQAKVENELKSSALRSGRSETGPIELRLIHKDGTYRWVRISYQAFADRRLRNPAIHIVGSFRDQTRSVRLADRHQRFMEMLSSLGIAYFRSSFDGETLETSEAESQILGYSQQEIMNLDRRVLYQQAEDRERLIRKLRENHGNPLRARRRVLRKDGQWAFTEGNLRVVKGALRGDMSIEGLYQDVTQRLQLQNFVGASTEEVLLEDELLQKMLENEQRHHDYLSGLGHQLLTPLSSLVETLANLEEDLLNDRGYATKRLRWVTGQTKQCMRMVRNLSYMDKILRQEPFEKKDVNLAKICIETKLDFAHILEERSLRLELDANRIERLVPVRGHEDMLRQVLINLVDNAIKYSVTHSRIRILPYRWTHGCGIEVCNRGLPIPAGLREEIFKRGFRANRAQAMVPWGTGLGLWLVRKILEAHNATIECDEVNIQKKRHTCFRIVFPVPPGRTQ